MWKIEYTKRFLKELASLPKHIQNRVEIIVFQELISDNPFSLGYIPHSAGCRRGTLVHAS